MPGRDPQFARVPDHARHGQSPFAVSLKRPLCSASLYGVEVAPSTRTIRVCFLHARTWLSLSLHTARARDTI